MVMSSEPAFVDSIMIPARELITVGLFAAVIVVLVLRIRTATPLMRRALAPVLSVALMRAASMILYFPIRRVSPDAAWLDIFAWIYVLTLPGMALAFVLGLVRARLMAGNALQGLALRLAQHPQRKELTNVLQTTMEDPTLELAYCDRSRSRSTSTTRSSSRFATTAAGSPARRSGPGSASRACTTGSPRSAGG